MIRPLWEDRMQDKLIARDEPYLEDIDETDSADGQPSPATSALPMIEVTYFDDADHPADSYRRPLHSFL
ncbi:hypothetical protein AB3X55_08895 [Alphaproteobacteria bacterium LSUCC0719]